MSEIALSIPNNEEITFTGDALVVRQKQRSLEMLLPYRGLAYNAYMAELQKKKDGDLDAFPVHPTTIRNWLRTDPGYELAYSFIPETQMDLAEKALMNKIEFEENITAIMYKLNNHGASRGYMPPAVLANNTVVQNEIHVKPPAEKPKK